MTFRIIWPVVVLFGVGGALASNADTTSLVQRTWDSESNTSVTKLYMSNSSGNKTATESHQTTRGGNVALAAKPPLCRNAGDSFEEDRKGVLFPYASEGLGSSCNSDKYCIGECAKQIFNAPFEYTKGTDKLICNKTNANLGCNLKTGLKAVFIDFDGTIELYDALADQVNEQLQKDWGNDVTWNETKDNDPQGLGLEGRRFVTGGEMVAALHKVFQSKNGDTDEVKQTNFINDYFGAQRLQKLKQALDFFKNEKKVQLYIMSASWAPISAKAWAYYLEQLTSDPTFGVDLKQYFTGILTVADPGGDTPGNKAFKIAEIMASLGADMNSAVHIDNSYKYMQQVVRGDRMVDVPGNGSAGGVNPTNAEENPSATNNGVQCAHFAEIARIQGWDFAIC